MLDDNRVAGLDRRPSLFRCGDLAGRGEAVVDVWSWLAVMHEGDRADGH